MTSKWIQAATNPKTKGALHRMLGVKQGEKIPMSALQRAKAKGGLEAKRANFALNLRHIAEAKVKGVK